MTHEIILHNFATSPFSEKIRLIFGMKGLAWRSVEIPMMLPKPDLMPLTGGYRKTPVMQIGADIFCDTQIIIREMERRFPAPGPDAERQGPALCDRLLVRPQLLHGQRAGDLRAGRRCHAGGLQEGPRGHVRQLLGRGDEGGRRPSCATSGAPMPASWPTSSPTAAASFSGDNPTIIDAHGYMNLWFLKGAVPDIADEFLAEWPKLGFWFTRLSAIGHGEMTPMDAKEALAVAHAAAPEAERAEDAHDPRGLKPGNRVTIAADDYGRDPVEGEIIFTTAHEIAILRNDPAVGAVAVHFPRAGFVVSPL